MRLTCLLLLLTISVNAQDVIDFKRLYDKQVKSTANYSVSDNTIDFKNIDHHGNYYVKFIGDYPKRLTLKNLVNGKIIIEGTISAATDNKTFQLADIKGVTLDLTRAKITGTGSNGVCGQLVYIYGKWRDVTVLGGTLEQISNSGGAAFQVESYSDPNFSHGKLVTDGLIVIRATGEGEYILFNQPSKAYLDTLIIRNTNISNTRRDFWQLGNVRHTIIENNRGTNGGLERNLDHVSGFSLNGKNTTVIIRNNIVDRVPQFIYSANQSKIEVEGNTYTQGDAMPVNQAIYTKSPMTLNQNTITAPNALIAAITADGAKVELIAPNTITAPKLERHYNGGSVIETIPPPTVIEYVGPLNVTETTTYDGVKTFKYVYRGTELIEKP